MSDAEREYICKASESLQVGGTRVFQQSIVEQAFPEIPANDGISEGYAKHTPGLSTYQQLRNALNYGVGIFSARWLPNDGGVYEVYRIR